MISTLIIIAASMAVQPATVRPGSSVKIVYKNENFAGHRVRAHFGFNGWHLGDSQDLAMRETGEGFVLEAAVPEGARALHVAFCKDSCDPSDWDNRSGRDYAWPVIFPYIGPILTWNERTRPESGVVISFETGSAMSAAVEINEAGKPPRRVASSDGDTHRVELTDLKPATTYEYRIVSDNGLASDRFRFKTARPPASIDRVRFVVFGDAQDDGVNGRFAALAREMASRETDADFILSTGDLPANDKPGDWWTFFDKGRPLLSSKVLMPAIGNHETPTVDSNPDHRSFARYFALPAITEERPFYRFTFGPAEFFGMNSERPAELARGGVQYEWLKAKLAVRDAMPWRFAYWHIPPFNAGTRHYQQQGTSRALSGLFDGRLDWQFGGHEHLYQRMKPLRDAERRPRPVERYGRNGVDGVGFVVVPASGTAGSTGLVTDEDHAHYRDRLAFPIVAPSDHRVDSWIGYLRVEINGPRFQMEAVRVPASGGESQVVDRVDYAKGD